MPPKIVVITGPTATGKTALGAALAREKGGEVVSADSMQIYKHMDIGTAKPTKEETLGVPHHMIDVVEPGENYSAARYVEDASKICDDIIARGKLPVIVGGTGLYIESLIRDREFAQNGDEKLRQALSARYEAQGGKALLCELAKCDPETAARLHPNDKKRIIRALEVFYLTKIPISEHDRRSRETPPRYDAVKIALGFENRQDLYDRIDRRVDIMMENGLLNEVYTLLGMGISPDCTAMQAIGYKELVPVIQKGAELTVAVEAIKRESRRYAKRQLSWFRRDSTINWIIWKNTPNIQYALRLSTEFLEKFG